MVRVGRFAAGPAACATAPLANDKSPAAPKTGTALLRRFRFKACFACNMQGLLRAMTRIRLACRGHEASVKKVRNFRRQTCSCARNQIRPALRQADCSDTGTDWHQRPIEPLRDLLDTPSRRHDDVHQRRVDAVPWTLKLGAHGVHGLRANQRVHLAIIALPRKAQPRGKMLHNS
jgi:hypothetical protein